MEAMKCVDGHPMLKGKKFCGACGKGPAEPQEEMVKCSSCEAEMVKAQHFCADCGAAAPSDSENLDGALNMLSEFSKARTAQEEDLTARPEVDLDAIAAAIAPEVAQMLKGAAITDDDGQPTEQVNAMPVVEELFKAVSSQAAENRAYTDHTLKFLGYLAEGQARLIKAQLAIGAKLKGIEGQIDAFGNQSRGRKAVTNLAVTNKPLPGTDGAPALDGRADLRGLDLMVKCSMLPSAKGGLNSSEMSQLEQHTNLGHGIAEIADSGRPALARRVLEVLQTVGAAAH